MIHLVQTLLESYYPGTKGYFIEIGCWDGIHLSNTIHLERRGWHGICVDPFPKNFNDRTCILERCAVSDKVETRKFIKVSIDRRHGGDVSYFSGFKDTIDNNPGIARIIYDHCNYDEVFIDTVPVEDIFAKHNPPKFIQFLCIDTEGSELNVLNGIPFDKYRFGIIMVEHNQNEQRKQDMLEFMTGKGYLLCAETDIDFIFKGNI